MVDPLAFRIRNDDVVNAVGFLQQGIQPGNPLPSAVTGKQCRRISAFRHQPGGERNPAIQFRAIAPQSRRQQGAA